MNAILATIMITPMSVLVDTSARAQTRPAPTLSEMKSAVEQQANQEKQATKEAVQAEKAKAQQAVADEKQKAKNMVESKKSKATAKAESNNSALKTWLLGKSNGRKDGGGAEAKGCEQGAKPGRSDHAEHIG